MGGDGVETAVIIYNPKSGDEQGTAIARLLEERLEESFAQVKVLETQAAGDASDFAQQACEESVHSIFVIGGDGTVNEVIEGMTRPGSSGPRPILGILPGGTFNAVARNLAIPMNPRRAVKMLDLNQVAKIDIGRCNEKAFGFIFSIGDVPESVHEVSNEDKTRFAMIAYFVNIAKHASKNTIYPLKVTIDGKIIEGEYSHLVVLLGGHVGEFEFTDKAIRYNDGYLHLFLLKEANFWNKLSVVSDLLGKRVESNESVQYVRGENIRIESSLPHVATDIDGDLGDDLPVEIKVLPQALTVYSLDGEESYFLA